MAKFRKIPEDTTYNYYFRYRGGRITLDLPPAFFSRETFPAFGCYQFRAHKHFDSAQPIICYLDVSVELGTKRIGYIWPKLALVTSNSESEGLISLLSWMEANSFQRIGREEFFDGITQLKDARIHNALKERMHIDSQETI